MTLILLDYNLLHDKSMKKNVMKKIMMALLFCAQNISSDKKLLPIYIENITAFNSKKFGHSIIVANTEYKKIFPHYNSSKFSKTAYQKSKKSAAFQHNSWCHKIIMDAFRARDIKNISPRIYDHWASKYKQYLTIRNPRIIRFFNTLFKNYWKLQSYKEYDEVKFFYHSAYHYLKYYFIKNKFQHDQKFRRKNFTKFLKEFLFFNTLHFRTFTKAIECLKNILKKKHYKKPNKHDLIKAIDLRNNNLMEWNVKFLLYLAKICLKPSKTLELMKVFPSLLGYFKDLPLSIQSSYIESILPIESSKNILAPENLDTFWHPNFLQINFLEKDSKGKIIFVIILEDFYKNRKASLDDCLRIIHYLNNRDKTYFATYFLPIECFTADMKHYNQKYDFIPPKPLGQGKNIFAYGQSETTYFSPYALKTVRFFYPFDNPFLLYNIFFELYKNNHEKNYTAMKSKIIATFIEQMDSFQEKVKDNYIKNYRKRVSPQELLLLAESMFNRYLIIYKSYEKYLSLNNKYYKEKNRSFIYNIFNSLCNINNRKEYEKHDSEELILERYLSWATKYNVPYKEFLARMIPNICTMVENPSNIFLGEFISEMYAPDSEKKYSSL